MKAKKARKRLRRVEDLLKNVIKKCSGTPESVQELLDTAKTAVAGALTNLQRSKKPPARAAKARPEAKRPATKAAAAGQQLSKAG